MHVPVLISQHSIDDKKWSVKTHIYFLRFPRRQNDEHARGVDSVPLPQPDALPAAAGARLPSPLAASPLHAEVLGHRLPALVALDRAAPVELAVAAGHHLGLALLHGQPALSAQPLAAPLLPLAQSLALLEALAALGARQAQRAVLQAVVRGVFQVDQLFARDGVEGVGDGPPTGRAVPGSPEEIHLQGPVVLLLQVVPDLAELWQLQPAGLSGAAARHSVTLARPLHCPLHSLWTEGCRGKVVIISGPLMYK